MGIRKKFTASHIWIDGHGVCNMGEQLNEERNEK